MPQELADYERPHAPDVAYVDSDDAAIPYECWKPAVLLKGRSYMYGLEDGELPDLPGKWCGLPEHAAPGAAIRRGSALISSCSCPRLVGRGGS